MIKPLRNRHRRIVGALAFALPVIFLAGLNARKSIPEQKSTMLPSQRNASVQTQIFAGDDLWPDLAIRTIFSADTSAAGGVSVQVTRLAPLKTGDPLVYWLPGGVDMWSSPGDDAVLLGTLSNNPGYMPLPAKFKSDAGSLLIYSLARGEVISATRIPDGLNEEGQ